MSGKREAGTLPRVGSKENQSQAIGYMEGTDKRRCAQHAPMRKSFRT